MKGFIYRLGTAVKEAGERTGRIPVVRLFARMIICLGLAIRGLV
jgi:hypothetical protein